MIKLRNGDKSGSLHKGGSSLSEKKRKKSESKRTQNTEDSTKVTPEKAIYSPTNMSTHFSGSKIRKDRFIPDIGMELFKSYSLRRNRDVHDLDFEAKDGSSPSGSGRFKLYNKLVISEMLGVPDRNTAKPFPNGLNTICDPSLPSGSGITYGSWNGLSPLSKYRNPPCQPKNVLIAPGMEDDFYLNLLDWSFSNVLAVGLGQKVYLWSATSKKFSELTKGISDLTISSVAWLKTGTCLAVADSTGRIKIWDVTMRKRIREFSEHSDRIATMAWINGILTSGSRDKTIIQHDARMKNSFICMLEGHDGEVCSLKWNKEENLLVSGGDDNKIVVWDNKTSQPLLVPQNAHSAAVKALAWSPSKPHLLVSGGGDNDRKIKIWNVNTGQIVNQIETASSVCNLHWSTGSDQIISSHGSPEKIIALWKPTASSLKQINSFFGHTKAILYMAASPDDKTVVSGSPDETLRFWDVQHSR